MFEVICLVIKDMIGTALKQLKKVGGVDSSAVVTRDGLLIASDISDAVDAETFAAMTATMVGAAETAMNEVGAGIPDRVIVESKKSKIISIGAGEKALLIVMTESDASLGLILLKMRETSEKIVNVLN
jgi:predicted regulator of Ras-like GTPase activity (Roadblock/LC7/MglB family)